MILKITLLLYNLEIVKSNKFRINHKIIYKNLNINKTKIIVIIIIIILDYYYKSKNISNTITIIKLIFNK